MTSRAFDNLRIAAKVLACFVVPLALLFALQTYVLVLPQPGPGIDVYSEEPSTFQKVGLGIYVVLLFVTFVFPLIVLRRELQKRRGQK